MIVSVNLFQQQTPEVQQKIAEQQKVMEQLYPILNDVPTLVFFTDDSQVDSLFEQQFIQLNDQPSILYSHDEQDYQTLIEGIGAIVLTADKVDNTQMMCQSLLTKVTDNQRVVFDGCDDILKLVLSGDSKPYAICVQENRLSNLLSLSKETISTMLPSEIMTDPLFEDVPFVFIYNEAGIGYLNHTDELYDVSIEHLDVSKLNHTGMLLGLAKGLSDEEKSTEEIVTDGIVCAISAIENQDVVFDKHFYKDKINVIKLA